MTILHKKISRRTAQEYTVLSRKMKPIVVSLLPGDVIEFRESKGRHHWQLPVHTVFALAVRTQVEADRRARKEAKKNK